MFLIYPSVQLIFQNKTIRLIVSNSGRISSKAQGLDVRVESVPISIHENQDFEELGYSGEGTFENPYIIENLYIQSNSTTLIDIKSTNVHFIVRNCVLDGIEPNFGAPGIILDNVSHGIIMDNWIKSTIQAIVLVESDENRIFRNPDNSATIQTNACSSGQPHDMLKEIDRYRGQSYVREW